MEEVGRRNRRRTSHVCELFFKLDIFHIHVALVDLASFSLLDPTAAVERRNRSLGP